MIGPVGRLALVQPRVGIGDMVWHLPHIQALARAAGGHVTLVTRRRSIADQVVGIEDGISEIFWLERGQWDPADARHQGTAGFVRLVRDLRRQRFDAAVLLTRSRNLGLAVAAAGIPLRYGFGAGWQRLFLNRSPRLPAAALQTHPYDQSCTWLAAAGVALPEPEPRMAVRPSAEAAVRARLRLRPGSFVALGIAGSDAWKRWAPASFAALAAHLLRRGWPNLVLLGGAAEQAEAQAILGQLGGADAAKIVAVLGCDLREVAALLRDAAFYVGVDTGVLNIAAAVGTRAYGLFGSTPVLRHSRRIIPILPDGPPDQASGMARISVGRVIAALEAERVAAG